MPVYIHQRFTCTHPRELTRGHAPRDQVYVHHRFRCTYTIDTRVARERRIDARVPNGVDFSKASGAPPTRCSTSFLNRPKHETTRSLGHTPVCHECPTVCTDAGARSCVGSAERYMAKIRSGKRPHRSGRLRDSTRSQPLRADRDTGHRHTPPASEVMSSCVSLSPPP